MKLLTRLRGTSRVPVTPPVFRGRGWFRSQSIESLIAFFRKKTTAVGEPSGSRFAPRGRDSQVPSRAARAKAAWPSSRRGRSGTGRSARCRRAYNRLGFAYQLGFLKLTGRLPKQQPLEVTRDLLVYVARQVGLDPSDLDAYAERQPTVSAHARQVREHLRYRPFGSEASRSSAP